LDRGDRALPGRHLPGCQEAHAMNISETVHIFRTIALTLRTFSTLHMLWGMERSTGHWNGLGNALRFAKRIRTSHSVWLLIIPFIDALNDRRVIIPLAVLLTWAEVRVSLYMPRVPVRHRGSVPPEVSP